MTKELLALKTWDTAAIDERQRELSNWVFQIWKFPGEAPPTMTPEPAAARGESKKAANDEIAVLDQLPEFPT